MTFYKKITDQELSLEFKEKIDKILTYANDFDVIQDFISGNSPVGKKLEELLNNVGAIEQLPTIKKDNIISAINELYNAIVANNSSATTSINKINTSLTSTTTNVTSLTEATNNAKKNNITGTSNTSLSARLDSDYKYLNSTKTIPNDILTPTSKCRFIGHRGFNFGVPENTLIGFQYASNSGFFGVETDVQCTKDGYWILHHDTTIDRMTNGTGNIKDMLLTDIKQYYIDAGNGINLYPKMRIPTFEEFLQVCKRYNVVPVVEIKGSGYKSANFDELIRLVRKYGFENKCIIISFTTSFLDEIRKRSYGIVLAPLIPISKENLQYVKSLGNAMINPDNSTLEVANVEQAHQSGVLVMTWTVNNYDKAKELINMGVDFITTDFLVGGGRI
ncbi:glycerophosphodiester phosphodiesterase [Priestia megaterium]|uniref:glycerophosphodiester phosphodiesterase n=1 Tax=Priestia megaterium TaxID=1404 RepID=UPI00287743FC|nr:glycerophosphodiester phosphodiesterase family protein [Priestia megaterium]